MWHNGEYLTHLITDRAVEFVEAAADGDDPFFGYVAYNAPHYPMHAPEKYRDRFPDLPPERQIFAAMLAAVDDSVGSLLDAFDDADITDETIVIFTSDHGPSQEVRNHLDGNRKPYRGGSTGDLRGEKGNLYYLGILAFTSLNWGVMLNTADKSGFMTDPGKIHWMLIPMAAIILI